MCAAYLAQRSGGTLLKESLLRLSYDGSDTILTVVTGNKTIQEMSQMGKNILAIILMKRTKQ